jgi:hypothetical protein
MQSRGMVDDSYVGANGKKAFICGRYADNLMER